MTAQATVLEELADEVTLLVEWLKEGTKSGSAGREFANGLQRDLYVLEQATARSEPATDHATWAAPFLESFMAKLVLGAQLMPKAADRLKQSANRLGDLQGRNSLLATLRREALPFLAEVRLAGPGRAYLEKTQALETVCMPNLLRAREGAPPPELALAARLVEGIGLHLAFQRAHGERAQSDEELETLARRIEGWLTDLGARAENAAAGKPAPGEACKVETPGRVAGFARGLVVAGLTPGLILEQAGQKPRRLAQPVVLVSAGAESNLAGAVRAALAKAPEGQKKALTPAVDAAAQSFDAALDDAAKKPAERARVAMELVDTVRALIEADARALDPMLAALGKDLGAGGVTPILAAPGSPAAPGPELAQVAVFSNDVPAGKVVALLRPGLKVGAEVVRPALAQVSHGEPPPGILDEVLELLPADDPRGAHLRARLERARCLSAGDAGAALSRELADLALFMRDEALGDAARKALRLVIEEPPAELSGQSGWEAVRELLAEHLEALFDDGESGQLAAFRLVRPWLQGLRTGNLAGARLRSLAEAMDGLLSLFDEALGATARAWLFSNLERLGGEGLGGGGHAARLARTVSKKIRSFYDNQELTPALELTQALQRSGLLVFPPDGEKLELCPDPEALFHRLETVYSEDVRGKVVGKFEPAVVAGSTPDAPKETGSVTVSLGKEPAAVAWLKGNPIRMSRLAAAGPRLAEELSALDKRRFLGELRGDAGAERAFAQAAGKLITAALEEAGWQRGDDDRHALGKLFELLGSDFRIEVLPGYLSYRRLRELQQTVGAEVKVDIVRQGQKKITLKQIGALWRDDVLAPLDMLWCTGPPPEYVAHLRQIPWIAAILDGKQPAIEIPPATRDAVLDFDSPDAQSIDGVVRALTTIVTWLATEHPSEVGKFTQIVKNAPGLEFTFFPLPGQTYPRDQMLAALDRADTPDSLEVVRDAGREDGQVVHVDRIAIYQKGKRLSEEPRARFALKTLPKAAEALNEALDPLLKSGHVPGQVKAELRGHATRLALIPVGEGQRDVELKAFKTLLSSRMVDPSYPARPENVLHGAAAYLAGRLEAAGVLKIERFEGKKKIDEAKAGLPKDGAEIDLVFCLAGSPELVAVKRPFVTLEGNTIQKAFLLQGVPTSDAAVLEFDQVLLDSLDRMRLWVDGPGALIDPTLDQTKRVVVPRTIQRIDEIRKKMFEAHNKKKPVMPPDTQIRDLIRFVIDQVHRAEDGYALLPDKTYRGAFGELVFKDVVFRAMGPYLSKRFNQSIDTSVVEGADTQALVGKFKLETTGPRPKRESMKVYSVIVPAYSQDGVCIRPATVRVGDYD